MVESITPTVSPALEHIIERPRLIARLEEGGGARVTVFAAPAGYGKTTLARQWSERQTGPVGWYRATRASGDVALLAVELDELLASTAPELPREPGKVASIASVNPTPKPLGRAIVRTFEPLTQDVLLVVDEWEAAATDEAEELMSMLVDGLPIRFVLTSRERPDWFAPRLAIYGEGLEIGAEELAMTDEEAADVLFYLRDPEARAEVAAVAAGWPAVLGLAALNARSGRTERSGLLPDTLYDYLATELIQGATREAQEAATVVAITSVQKVETARVLLGPAAEEQLGAAEAHGLLALVSGRRRVVMHPLIRELVVERFRRGTAQRRLLAGLAPVVIEHQLWNEAQAIAEAAPDAEFISQVLAVCLLELLRHGRVTSVQKWIELGRTASAQAGLLDYAEAEVALRQGETLRAYGLGVQASRGLDGDMAARAHLVAARAAHLTERSIPAREHIERATCLARSSGSREDAAWLRLVSALDEHSPESKLLLTRYRKLARAGIDQSLTAAAGELGIGHLEGGFARALDSAEAALSLVRGNANPLTHTSLLNAYSYLLVVAGRYEASLRASSALASTADTYELEFARRYFVFNRASALIGLRRFADADRALASLERQTRGGPGTYFTGNLAIQRARLYASVGDPKRGLDVLSSGPADDWTLGTSGEYLALRALLFAATDEYGQASETANDARGRSRGVEARSLALATEALVALRTNGPVDDFLDAAINTGALDSLVVGMRAAPDLATHLAARRDRREWLQRLFIASADFSLATAVGLRIPRPARRGQVLSARESEIHQLVAQGLTNEEIAKLLFISLSTTKVHVKHILDKLGVRSRVEAARLLSDDG